MKKILNSLGDWFQEKTSSPFWYTLFFSFILWNWQILYLLFGEDASKFIGPRIEYICKHYFAQSDPGISCNTFIALFKDGTIFLNFGIPILVAFLSIWLIPSISNFAFRQRLKFIERRELDIMNSNTKLGKEKKNEATRIVRDEDEWNQKMQEDEWSHEDK